MGKSFVTKEQYEKALERADNSCFDEEIFICEDIYKAYEQNIAICDSYLRWLENTRDIEICSNGAIKYMEGDDY